MGVGALPYATVDLTALTSITVEYRDGQTVPWSSPLATAAARFDSAGSPMRRCVAPRVRQRRPAM
jgi:hypothetical protein